MRRDASYRYVITSRNDGTIGKVLFAVTFSSGVGGSKSQADPQTPGMNVCE